MKWIYLLATLAFVGLAVAALLTGRGLAWAIAYLLGGVGTLLWGLATVKITRRHIRDEKDQQLR